MTSSSMLSGIYCQCRENVLQYLLKNLLNTYSASILRQYLQILIKLFSNWLHWKLNVRPTSCHQLTAAHLLI